MAAFIPVADNCSRTQNRQDAVGQFFNKVAEQGHYGGRTKPTNTRQGSYACSAAGDLLDSVNTRDAARMCQMMRKALERWQQTVPPATPLPPPQTPATATSAYPSNGLVLKLYVRDLPRPEGETDPRHNIDYVWFTKEEAASLLPLDLHLQQLYSIPQHLTRRLARFHFVDRARGESPHWNAEEVKQASLTLTLEHLDDRLARFDLGGTINNTAPPSMATNPFSGQQVDMERGIALTLQGSALYNRRQESFERFDLLATGTCWGATPYNARFDDLQPTPIGFALERAGTSLIEQTPPQALGANYFSEAV